MSTAVGDRLTAASAVAAGMIFGYLLWPAAGSALILLTPVQWWVSGGVAALLALTVGTLGIAERCSSRVIATALRAAPVLPVVSSAYLLIVFIS